MCSYSAGFIIIIIHTHITVSFVIVLHNLAYSAFRVVLYIPSINPKTYNFHFIYYYISFSSRGITNCFTKYIIINKHLLPNPHLQLVIISESTHGFQPTQTIIYVSFLTVVLSHLYSLSISCF